MTKKFLDPHTDYNAPLKSNPLNFPQYKEDIEYNLARLEGQLARMDQITDNMGGNVALAFNPVINDAKQFLLALRLALDPHRIDVI